MKKRTLRRLLSVASAAAICVSASAMFAACTTKYPEVTITYTFNSVDYKVEYKLSRYDAPQTVQHFIELADAGYYDGMCIHDYDSNYLYSGGYTLVDGELVEKDYFTEIKKLEAEGVTFTQSVWVNGSKLLKTSPLYISDDELTPLYTVYGEFWDNGNYPENGNDFYHSAGALVMYYADKGSDGTRVTTLRNDSGKENDGDKYDYDKSYKYNSATSLFYTFTGTSNSSRDNTYAVFGKTIDYAQLQDLLDAINDYIDEHEDNETDEDYSFTEEVSVRLNEYEPFESISKAGLDATYNTPVEMPIIIKSVKVNKY